MSKTWSGRMFIIIRVINGTTETLKNSNSHEMKIFDNQHSAQALANRLNQNIVPTMQWKVSERKTLKQFIQAE